MRLLGFAGPNAAAVDGVVSAVMEDMAGGYRRSFYMPIIKALLAARTDVVLATEALFGLGSVLGDSVSMRRPLPEWGGRSAYELVQALRELLVTEFGAGWRDDVVSYVSPGALIDPGVMREPITPSGVTGKMILVQFRGAVLREFGNDFLVKRAEQELAEVIAAERALPEGELPARALIFDDVLRPCEAQWLKDRGGAVVYVATHDAPDRACIGRVGCCASVFNDRGANPDPVHTLPKLPDWLLLSRDVVAKRVEREVA